MLSLIVAMSEKNRVIGLDGNMPWKLSADLKRFKKITTGHTVVMGRKTWESIPKKFRPLPNRRNIVLSKNPEYVAEGAEVFHALSTVLEIPSFGERLFVIGGESIFAEALPLADKIYLTVVGYDGEGDTYFPADPFETFEPMKDTEEIVEADGKNTHRSRFLVLRRRIKDNPAYMTF